MSEEVEPEVPDAASADANDRASDPTDLEPLAPQSSDGDNAPVPAAEAAEAAAADPTPEPQPSSPAVAATAPPPAVTEPATPPSPPEGNRQWKGPDFLQQFVMTTRAHGPQQGVNSPPARAYQGVKATIGADTFMMQHAKDAKSIGRQGVNQAPPSTHQGVKATIGSDSFMLDHLKKTKAAAAAGASHRPFQGVKASVGPDSFLNTEVQKAQNQMGARSVKKRALKPHIGPDALMFGHAKKAQESAGGISAPWNPIALFGSGSPNERPKVGADAWAVTQMRVTKAQTPASSKSYQGVKTSVGADSFHMAFLKSMSGWSKTKTKPREIML